MVTAEEYAKVDWLAVTECPFCHVSLLERGEGEDDLDLIQDRMAHDCEELDDREDDHFVGL